MILKDFGFAVELAERVVGTKQVTSKVILGLKFPFFALFPVKMLR